VGAFSLLSNVTVLMNLGSSLADLNHLTFDPGGAEPMLTCSWTYPVLQKERKRCIMYQQNTKKMHIYIERNDKELNHLSTG